MAYSGYVLGVGGGYDGYSNNLRFLLNWEFNWAGFSATGVTLERNGWQMSEMKDMARMATMIVLENKQQGCMMASSMFDQYYWQDQYTNFSKSRGFLPFGLRTCTREFIMQTAGPAPVFNPVSLCPTEISLLDFQRYRYSDISPFKSIVSEDTKQIIIPKELSVDEMLKSILDKQKPAQVEYFNNKVKNKEKVDCSISAQIIQLRA